MLVAIAGRYADLADAAADLETFEAAEGRLRSVLGELEQRPGGDDDSDDAGAPDDERSELLALIRRGPTMGDASHT